MMTTDKEPSTVNRQIDENLKRVYQEMVNEDLPDRLKDLLEKLKNQSNAQ